jgi:hypothetical protein
MIGAIIGNIVGSRFEGVINHKSKDFELFNEQYAHGFNLSRYLRRLGVQRKV